VRPAADDPNQDITRCNGDGKGHRTVAYVELVLINSHGAGCAYQLGAGKRIADGQTLPPVQGDVFGA
jgi:hypothetical protein